MYYDENIITGDEWTKLSPEQKILAVEQIIKHLALLGMSPKVDDNWFVVALDAFYIPGEQTTLLQAIKMVGITGNAFKNENRDRKIKDLISTLTEFEIKIWQYIRERWNYYDSIDDKYAGDKYTQQVFSDAAKEFGIQASKAEQIWDKVDKATLGIEK